MNTELLGKTIKKERELSKLTVSELSRLSGVSVGVISSLENNKGKIPSVENLYKITKELGVDMGVLVEQTCKPQDDKFSVIGCRKLLSILDSLFGMKKTKLLIQTLYRKVYDELGDAILTMPTHSLKKEVLSIIADMLLEKY